MAEKAAGTTSRAAKAAQEKPERNASGFYIYIGPNIKGLIQTGTVFRGDRENVLRMAGPAIEKHPKVKSLIVSGDALPEARIKVKNPGNVLYANYQALKSGEPQNPGETAGKEGK